MSLSSTLWSSTGIIHCMAGLAIPELREPLMRVIQDGMAVETATDLADRYERECTVWFQVAGVLMFLQGCAWKHYIKETKQEELPQWWGWSLTVLGAAGIKLMPVSGFWLVMAQGIRIVYRTSSGTNSMGEKKE